MSMCNLPGCSEPGVHAHLIKDDDGKLSERTGTSIVVTENSEAAVSTRAVRRFCLDIGINYEDDTIADIRRWVEQGKARDASNKAQRDAVNVAGWGHPINARAWHFFPAGDNRSLCGKWHYAGTRNGGEWTPNEDDCKTCVKRALKLGSAS